MSSILPFVCGHHPVWSLLANEIHAAIWDCVGLGKVQGFVREWASDWGAAVNAAEAARQQKFAFARQALNYPEDRTLNLIADNLPDDWQLKETLWEPELPQLPLPPSHRPRSPAEKWAALAAVHDVFDLTGDKVLPWPLPEDDQNLAALTEWMRGEGGAYLVLMRAASVLTDTDADPVGRWLEDVKKGGERIDVQEKDEVTGRLLAVMDDNELKVVRLAESDNSVKERMRLIIAIDERYKGKTSSEWSTLLKRSEQMVRKAWKECPELRYLKEER